MLYALGNVNAGGFLKFPGILPKKNLFIFFLSLHAVRAENVTKVEKIFFLFC